MATGKTWTQVVRVPSYSLGEGWAMFCFVETYDAVANTSTITLEKIHLDHSTYSGWTSFDYTLIIDGVTVAKGNAYGWNPSTGTGVDVAISGVSYTVAHNYDGTKSVTVSCSNRGFGAGSFSMAESCTNSQTVVLTTIPRTSELSAANGTLGVAQTLTVTRKSAAYTHTITYACGSASGTICTMSTAASLSWSPAMDLALQNIRGTAVTVTFTITTYSGNTAIGSETKTISCAIPDSVKPTVSDGWATVAPHNTGAVEGLSCYVQDYSAAAVTFDTSKITLAYGAEIASCQVTCGTQTITAAPHVTATLTTAGEQVLQCTVIDSRGRQASGSLTVTVEPYAMPTLSDISLYRSDSYGEASDIGLYIAACATVEISSLAGENTHTLQVRYKQRNGEFGAYLPLTSGVLSAVGEGTISVTDSYVAEILLTDRLGNTAMFTDLIPTEAVFFSGREGGKAAGFGKHPEGDALLDVNWDLKVRRGAEITGDFKVDGSSTLGDLFLGNLSAAGTAAVAGLTIGGKSLLDIVYPVNSIYFSYSHTSPAALFGGTWTRITQFLWGCDANGAIGATGGEYNHTLTEYEIPSHSHFIGNGSWWGTGGDGHMGNVLKGTKYQDGTSWGRTDWVGGNGAHNNMPPYIQVSIWRRTA